MRRPLRATLRAGLRTWGLRTIAGAFLPASASQDAWRPSAFSQLGGGFRSLIPLRDSSGFAPGFPFQTGVPVTSNTRYSRKSSLFIQDNARNF